MESSSQANSGESSQGTASHLADPLKMSLYLDWNVARVTYSSVSLETSASEGQMSFRNTSLPSSVTARGSLSRSMSTRPAMAYATTRGGEAR